MSAPNPPLDFMEQVALLDPDPQAPRRGLTRQPEDALRPRWRHRAHVDYLSQLGRKGVNRIGLADKAYSLSLDTVVHNYVFRISGRVQDTRFRMKHAKLRISGDGGHLDRRIADSGIER